MDRPGVIEWLFLDGLMPRPSSNPRMNRARLYVDVEIPVVDGRTKQEQVDLIRERIVEQVAGHRTPMRLAETCTVSEWEE